MDKELIKIQSLMTTISELEKRFYSIENPEDLKRIKMYIANRYKYFFDWIFEK